MDCRPNQTNTRRRHRRNTLVLIGTNTGLGFEAAVHFAWMNRARLGFTPTDEAKEKRTLDCTVGYRIYAPG